MHSVQHTRYNAYVFVQPKSVERKWIVHHVTSTHCGSTAFSLQNLCPVYSGNAMYSIEMRMKCALIHPANMMEKALVERKMTCGLCYSNTLWAKFCPTYVIYTVSVLATRSIVQWFLEQIIYVRNCIMKHVCTRSELRILRSYAISCVRLTGLFFSV